MATTAHLEKLNPAQRKAVTHGEALPEKGYRAGPLLIVAGAGTGKTDTLAHRVAHLVIHGVDPARILMLTFTRRAATEMRRRAQEITRQALNEPLGGVSHSIAQRLSWTGTFHSIGNRLLRHYAPHLQLDPHFSVIDRADAADLIDSLRQELGLAGKEQRFPRKETCLQIYSNRVNTNTALQETLQRHYPWCAQWEQELTRLYRAYVEQKQHASLLDYDDLLLYWHAMMSEPRLAQHIGAHFDHVLVDEYQDTNRLQADILHALKPDGAGLAAVGDDAQAIYSFRAAAVENILGFAERFQPGAEVVTLAQNYRSTQQVLDVANAVMAEAPRQHRKYLLSVRGEGARARIVTVDELQSQAQYVCQEVLRRREANVPLNARAAIEQLAAGGHSFEALKAFSPPETAELDWRRLIELMQSLGDAQRPWPGQLQLAREWYRPHFERLYEQFHTRLGDLEQLEALSGQYPSRERFLTELTLDPPHATSDLAGRPTLAGDYLVLSTIHSAKGMEWDTVYVLNLVDGSFPSEFSTGRPELIEEERRLLYVALTRAQNDLLLIVPLKFHLTHQSRQADGHVYGGRSRFMTEKVHKTLEAVAFHAAPLPGGDALRDSGAPLTMDIAARLRDMW